MSTYFELITKVLQELKYPTVSTFSALTNPEHLEIKDAMNKVNRDTLLSDGYNTRERVDSLTIPANTTDYFTTVTDTLPGEVKENGIIVDNSSYEFVSDVSRFYTENVSEFNYGRLRNDFYFKSKDSARTATVLYLTRNFAETSGGTEKENMTLEDDTSIIPEEIQEQVLVFGTCYAFKGSNSADKRLAYWNAEYGNGIRQLNDYNFSQDADLKFTIDDNRDLRHSNYYGYGYNNNCRRFGNR